MWDFWKVFRIMHNELYVDTICTLVAFCKHFETSPQLLQLFRRMLQCCFAVKFKKCFEDNKTSPDLPSAWREEMTLSELFL